MQKLNTMTKTDTALKVEKIASMTGASKSEHFPGIAASSIPGLQSDTCEGFRDMWFSLHVLTNASSLSLLALEEMRSKAVSLRDNH